MRPERAIDQRIAEAREQFRIGQVTAVVGATITVVTSGGATPTINRLATWTPAIGDIVVIAMTPAGWVALGKIA